MAYMIPHPWDIAKPANGMESEKSLYDALANDEYSTRKGWHVVYSYRGDGRRDGHPVQDEYQIDFLLLIPGKGLVILEAKPTFSPPERLSDDSWRIGGYVDRNPYTKQHDNRAALQGHLEGTPFVNMPIHTMVAWPNLTRAKHASLKDLEAEASERRSDDPDYFPHQTICREDLPCIGEVIEGRLKEWADWWRADPARKKRQHYKLKYLADSRPKRDEVAGELRKIFAPESIGLRTDPSALRDLHSRILERLTKPQLDVQAAVLGAHQAFVMGPPGSGKTILAVEAARAHARVRGSGDVMLACFNDALSAAIRSRLEAVAQPGETLPRVVSLRELCVAALGADKVDAFGRNWERAIPDAALAIVDGAIPQAAVLVLDEAQQLLLASDETVDTTLYPVVPPVEEPIEHFDAEDEDVRFSRGIAIGPQHVRRGEKFSDSVRVLFDAVVEGGLADGRWLMYGDPTQDQAFTVEYSERLYQGFHLSDELRQVEEALAEGGVSTEVFGLREAGDDWPWGPPDEMVEYVESVEFKPFSSDEVRELEKQRAALQAEDKALREQGDRTAREWLDDGLKRTGLDVCAVQIETLPSNIRNPEGLYAYARRLLEYGDLKIDHGSVQTAFSAALPEVRYVGVDGIETLFDDSVRAWTWSGEGRYSDDEWDVAPQAAVDSLAGLLHELTISEPYEPADITVLSIAGDRHRPDHDVAARLAGQAAYRLAPFSERDSSQIGFGRIDDFVGLESRIVVITDFMNVWERYDDDWDTRAWSCHRAYLALTRATERAYLLLPEEVHYALYYDLFGWPEDIGHYKAKTDQGREYFRPLEGLEGLFPKALAHLATRPRPAENHVWTLGSLTR